MVVRQTRWWTKIVVPVRTVVQNRSLHLTRSYRQRGLPYQYSQNEFWRFGGYHKGYQVYHPDHTVHYGRRLLVRVVHALWHHKFLQCHVSAPTSASKMHRRQYRCPFCNCPLINSCLTNILSTPAGFASFWLFWRIRSLLVHTSYKLWAHQDIQPGVSTSKAGPPPQARRCLPCPDGLRSEPKHSLPSFKYWWTTATSRLSAALSVKKQKVGCYNRA